MEVNKDVLLRIHAKTTCEWTRGYISCVLDSNAPTRNQIARELIDSIGPSTQKIQCIKKIRENFGLGLKEAKALVDEYIISGQIVGLEDEDDDFTGAVV